MLTYLPAILLLICYATCRILELNAWGDSLMVQQITSVLGALFLVICVMWPAFQGAWNFGSTRFFQFDFIFGLVIGLSLYDAFFEGTLLFPAKLSTLDMLIASSVAWYVIRLWEARYLQRKTSYSGAFDDTFAQWNLDEIRPWILKRNALVAIAALIFSAIVIHQPSWGLILASTLPAFIPTLPWKLSQILSNARRKELFCKKFSDFERLDAIQLSAFHHGGVFSDLEPTFLDQWIHPDDEFSLDEILDVTQQLCQKTEHPLSKMIREHGKWPKRSLLKVEKVDVLPNLGVTAEFLDLQGRRTTAHWGGLSWHKILQHEMDSEGLNTIKAWREKHSAEILLLSLNRRIVAAFGYVERPREDANESVSLLKDLHIDSVLISSIHRDVDSKIATRFAEKAVNLLPVERKTQWKYWLERKPNILECNAWWDNPAASTLSLQLVDRANPGTATLGNFGRSLTSIPWLIRVSRDWRRFKKSESLIRIGLVAVSLMTAAPHLVLWLGFSSMLIWTLAGSKKLYT